MHPENYPELGASMALVSAIEPILKDADTHMHTNYLTENENTTKAALFVPLILFLMRFVQFTVGYNSFGCF